MLLCAPSLGVLDNWLPILHAARQAHPPERRCRIIALIPDRSTLAQLDGTDTTQVLADELIDATVAPLLDGAWVVADGLLHAKELAASARVIERLHALLAARVPRALPLLRWFRTRGQRARVSAEPFGPSADVRLLYDVRLHAKPSMAAVLQELRDAPRYSLHHGIALEQPGDVRTPPPDPENVRAAFLYGPDEVGPYVANFGLDPAVLHPVGVARHEPRWIGHVVRRSASRHDLPFERSVFVVSRPSGSPYLPKERKIAALRALHRVAWEEHGLPILIRLHPKEVEDGAVAAALPASGEGESWSRTLAHPLHVATTSVLAVTFLSGVALDMIATGVPVIEYLDVRGLEGIDTPECPRDSAGRLLHSPYRRDGLVLPVDDVEELRQAFARIAQDRAAVLAEQRAAMRSRFTDPTDAAQRMLALLNA